MPASSAAKLKNVQISNAVNPQAQKVCVRCECGREAGKEESERRVNGSQVSAENESESWKCNRKAVTRGSSDLHPPTHGEPKKVGSGVGIMGHF